MMNRMTPEQERAPASEPVWERPWSVEEIRRSSQSWSLAADAGVRGGPGDARAAGVTLGLRGRTGPRLPLHPGRRVARPLRSTGPS
nr:WASH complex subunit 2A-like [Saimiri boliviensis boliviensis]